MHEDQYKTEKKRKLIRLLITIIYILVPFATSVFSTLHVVSLLEIGNVYWMAVSMAVIFEIGQIASMLGLSAIDDINKTLAWIVFIALALIQMLGNIYSQYAYIAINLQKNPKYLDIFTELYSMLFGWIYELFGTVGYKVTTTDAQFFLATFVGMIVSTMAILLMKSLVNMIRESKQKERSNHILVEDVSGSKSAQENNAISIDKSTDIIANDSALEQENKILIKNDTVNSKLIDVDSSLNNEVDVDIKENAVEDILDSNEPIVKDVLDVNPSKLELEDNDIAVQNHNMMTMA